MFKKKPHRYLSIMTLQYRGKDGSIQNFTSNKVAVCTGTRASCFEEFFKIACASAEVDKDKAVVIFWSLEPDEM